MKIAVVGSRGYADLESVRQFVREQERSTVIVSGGATGVDTAAVDEAKRLRMPYEVHLPDWTKHGRAAGVIRNRVIVEASDEVVAFWDGKSRGTLHSINIAKELGKPLRVVPRTGADMKDAYAIVVAVVALGLIARGLYFIGYTDSTLWGLTLFVCGIAVEFSAAKFLIRRTNR